MKIFFDVDYTILGLDNSLRPQTKETFQALLDEDHQIYIWSGMGERWEVIEKHQLEPFVSGVFEKPTHHFHERLEELRVPFEPDFVIDDYPEVVAAFGECGCHLIFSSAPLTGKWNAFTALSRTLLPPEPPRTSNTGQRALSFPSFSLKSAVSYAD